MVTVALIKKIWYKYILCKMRQYFPKLCECSSRNTKLELDLTNYAIEADLRGATGLYTSNLAAKSDLASLKAEVDKTDTDKQKTL